MSDIENSSIANPSEPVVRKIASATGFPEGYFYLGPLPDFPDGSWRKLKRGSSKVTAQVKAQARHVAETVQRESAGLRLPEIRIEPATTALAPGDWDEIERLATAVRRDALQVGVEDPITNMCRAVERAGVLVAVLSVPMPDHSGFSAWPDQGLDGRPLIVLPNDEPGDRMRFTIAHELGHLVLHSLRGSPDPKTAEMEAHRFAGALLLPRKVALRTIRRPVTLSSLSAAKQGNGISIAACAKRALDLDMIDQTHFISLRKQLSARGWTKHEPIEVDREQPVLIKRILDARSGEGPVTRRADRVKMNRFQYRNLVA